MTKNEAIKYFGSSVALARALGITRGAVTNWGDRIPIVRQYQIQVLTDGSLLADELANQDQPPGSEAAA
jgi:hypothetical protein